MGKKPLTEEQREAKNKRDRECRASMKKGPKATKPKAEKASKAKTSKPAKGDALAPAPAKEVDLGRVAPDKAKGMLLKVHKLEKGVEAARVKLDRASQVRRAAKANLEKAQDALNQEIHAQRYGPGPLFEKAGNPDLEPSSSAKSPVEFEPEAESA